MNVGQPACSDKDKNITLNGTRSTRHKPGAKAQALGAEQRVSAQGQCRLQDTVSAHRFGLAAEGAAAATRLSAWLAYGQARLRAV